MQGIPERKPEEKGEFHHTTRSLRPNVFPFAYIRSFYNELDEASMIPDELKDFAYERSLKQIDNFYACAANYCKKLQQALQNCRNNLEASKLYDAFERDHQVLANHRNREWMIAVNDRMRELGIAVPKDIEDDVDEDNETTDLELAAELLEGSTETQSISTESNTTIGVSFTHERKENENASHQVRPISRPDDKISHQSESEVETRPCHHRPRESSNEPKQLNPVAAHELRKKVASRDVNQSLFHTAEDQHPPEFATHRGAGTPAPNPDNLQRTRLSGPDIWDNHIASSPIAARQGAGAPAQNPDNLQHTRPSRPVPGDVWDNHITSHTHRGAGVPAPNLNNPQRTRPSGPDPENVWNNYIPSRLIRKYDEDSEIWQNFFSKSELGSRNKAYYRTNHPGWKSYKDARSPLTRGQSPDIDVQEDARHQEDRIADSHFSDFGLKDKAYYQTNDPERVRKSAKDDESSHTNRNPPRDAPIFMPPPGYNAKSLPREGMHASASSKQSGPRRFHSDLEGVPSPEETNYAERPDLEAQLGARSAYNEIRISTPLSNIEIHDSQHRAHLRPQDSGTQIRDVRPSSRDDVLWNHEAFGTGLGYYDGVRDTSTSSYPTASLRRHHPTIPSSNETPIRYAASPAKTHDELGIETERLNHSMGSYSRRSEPELPSKDFSAAGAVRNMPSTSNSNSLPSRQQQGSHGPADFPSALARSGNSDPYPERIPSRTRAGSRILQDPRLPHEKAMNWPNAEDWPGYPAIDDRGHGRQSPSTRTAAKPDDTTQDIDWQAFDRTLEHIIENLYAGDVGNHGKSYSQGMEDPNHAVATDDPYAEDRDASLLSSDESDLTDSDKLDEEMDVSSHMNNPSISPSINIGRTVPYAEESRTANVGRLRFT